jgi:hypothetical protein
MIRTQVQLPDELYDEVRRVAESREWSIAEVLRRGAEYIVRCYPPDTPPAAAWSPPAPRHLGPFLAPGERWRELAWDVEEP